MEARPLEKKRYLRDAMLQVSDVAQLRPFSSTSSDIPNDSHHGVACEEALPPITVRCHSLSIESRRRTLLETQRIEENLAACLMLVQQIG